jgi:hypothetical protein
MIANGGRSAPQLSTATPIRILSSRVSVAERRQRSRCRFSPASIWPGCSTVRFLARSQLKCRVPRGGESSSKNSISIFEPPLLRFAAVARRNIAASIPIANSNWQLCCFISMTPGRPFAHCALAGRHRGFFFGGFTRGRIARLLHGAAEFLASPQALCHTAPLSDQYCRDVAVRDSEVRGTKCRDG